MSQNVVLKTEVRTKHGTRESQRLRKKGLVPAVVYGHKEAPEHLTVSSEELVAILRHRVRNLEVEIQGKKQPVLIQEVQHDYLNRDIIHIDFRRVYADERIHTTIPVHLKGIARGVLSGGVLDHPLHMLHVDCLAASVPESIVVKIDDLVIGSVIHVKELNLPEGVKALGDPDAVVVQVRVAAAEVVVSPLEGAVEPEVITAKKKTEDAEE